MTERSFFIAHSAHEAKYKFLYELRERYGSWSAIPLWVSMPDIHHHRALKAFRDAERIEKQKAPGSSVTLKPLSSHDRTGNPLRPVTFDQLVGQDRLKGLLRRIIANARAAGRPLDHMLVVGASGTGKTTFAQIVANELGRTCYQIKAPVEYGVFEWLAKHGCDGDVVIVDEVHMLVQGDRRGITQAADPEAFYHALEDRRLPVAGEMLPFPAITFIGATTDAGLLPTAFLNRFPLQITLDAYTVEQMTTLAIANAGALNMAITDVAAERLGAASRRTPRVLNSYVKNALALVGEYDAATSAGIINDDVAREVIEVLNGTTPDGLTIDMQRMLVTLYRSARETRRGEWVHQASVNTIATALGHGRDTKYIALEVEPYLIQEGLVIVTHGGRQLSAAGINRAKELLQNG